MTVLCLEDVTVSYNMSRRRVDVLENTSLLVSQPGSIAVVGPSGSGKTSVLNLVAGFLKASSGRVRVLGKDLNEFSSNDAADFRARHIGFVFQAFHLLPQLTALDNVALPLRLQGVGRIESRERSEIALESVGLGTRGKHKPYEMSGGEQQRAAIARAIVTEPQILLADEPTGSLDDETQRTVVDILLKVTASRTLILVTHDRELAKRTEAIWEIRSKELHLLEAE